ncbi:hypothetical protein [Jeotgalibacillus proteolyticus]|uniref:hypothetical protein n=1 Tax=Jeotgalibacillus proteolyticus TaxID=2082395 RepID=UPI003CFA83D4
MRQASEKKRGMFGNASKKSKIVLGILFIISLISVTAFGNYNETLSEFREAHVLNSVLFTIFTWLVPLLIWRMFFYRI